MGKPGAEVGAAAGRSPAEVFLFGEGLQDDDFLCFIIFIFLALLPVSCAGSDRSLF
jgi:hypothetical protein